MPPDTPAPLVGQSDVENADPMPGRDVRVVNGWGPRCGCGGKSKLHLTSAIRKITPATSTFLCSACVEEAVVLLFSSRPEQPPYWPGDEARDEPYERPGAAMLDGQCRHVCSKCGQPVIAGDYPSRHAFRGDAKASVPSMPVHDDPDPREWPNYPLLKLGR